ncbi:hypothetical protein INR49_017740 [Caranx melampygus]|nr:hypothetical protein INR49_017740 [Caranx melampygus]
MHDAIPPPIELKLVLNAPLAFKCKLPLSSLQLPFGLLLFLLLPVAQVACRAWTGTHQTFFRAAFDATFFCGVGWGGVNLLDMQATGANIKHGPRSFSRCTRPSSVCIMVDRLLQDTEPPAEMVKHQTNISELKRSFLETGSSTLGLTEWEKRLSSSPARSPRADEPPMIEPLELEDTTDEQPAGGETKDEGEPKATEVNVTSS